MKTVSKLLGHAYLQCIFYSLMCLSLIHDGNFVAAALAILVVALFGALKKSNDLVKSQNDLLYEQHEAIQGQTNELISIMRKDIETRKCELSKHNFTKHDKS